MGIPKFFVGEKGPNWVWLQSEKGSGCNSFTVSYLHDGTCVMSGDYGVLTWKRACRFQQCDIGFPSPGTDTRYFAEKVYICEDKQNIYAFDKDEAIMDIRKELKSMEVSSSKIRAAIEEIEDFSTDDMTSWIDGVRKVTEILNEHFGHRDWWESNYGRVYSDNFKFRMACLMQVSELLRKELIPVVESKVETNE